VGLKALHIAIPVIDMGAAVSFYTELFNLNVTSRGDEYTHLYYGPHRISLIKTTPNSSSIQVGGSERKRSRHFGFHVESAEEVDLFATRLVKMGATIVSGPEDRGNERALFFVDPSGNQVEIYGSVPPS
jgi:extradiol dioxygenase family protein